MSFEKEFVKMQKDVHETAVSKGWHDEPKPLTECLLLVHCEISEAVEALRKGNKFDKHIQFYTEVEVELADVIIRIMDLAEDNHLDVSGAIMAKAEYNKTRPHMHGGKLF